MENALFFHYKTQKTFLHSLNPVLKIFLIVVLAVAAFYLPVKICIVLYPVLILFSAVFLKFRFSEIISDQKPTFAYIFLLYFPTILLNFSSFLQEDFYEPYKIFVPNLTYLPLLAHLAISLEITSIFYRTTSHSQFKDGFSRIEMLITRKDTAPLSDMLALALSFIPRISIFWSRLNKAWLSRGGKQSIFKVIYLFPKLFQVSMHEGYEKSLAIQNRS